MQHQVTQKRSGSIKRSGSLRENKVDLKPETLDMLNGLLLSLNEFDPNSKSNVSFMDEKTETGSIGSLGDVLAQETLITGILSKLSESKDKWKDAFFVLTDKLKLVCFKNNGLPDMKALAALNITGCAPFFDDVQNVWVLQIDGHDGFAEKKWTLKAEEPDDLRLWAEAITTKLPTPAPKSSPPEAPTTPPLPVLRNPSKNSPASTLRSEHSPITPGDSPVSPTTFLRPTYHLKGASSPVLFSANGRLQNLEEVGDSLVSSPIIHHPSPTRKNSDSSFKSQSPSSQWITGSRNGVLRSPSESSMASSSSMASASNSQGSARIGATPALVVSGGGKINQATGNSRGGGGTFVRRDDGLSRSLSNGASYNNMRRKPSAMSSGNGRYQQDNNGHSFVDVAMARGGSERLNSNGNSIPSPPDMSRSTGSANGRGNIGQGLRRNPSNGSNDGGVRRMMSQNIRGPNVASPKRVGFNM